MSISVQEPETGMECQLEIRLTAQQEPLLWSVTLPEGQVVLFSLQKGKWMNQTDGKTSKKFSAAIGHSLDLLSKHERTGTDIEALYRTPRSNTGSMHL